MEAKQARTEDRGLYEWVQALVSSVLAVVLLFTFGVRVMRVDGPSMRETLQDDDKMLVLNAALEGEVHSGDVVVLRKGAFAGGEPIVKRVIATAGQTVAIDFAAGTVTVDGQTLQEEYIRQPTQLDEGTAFPLTVPAGSVFVMGDNRNDSDDSRDPALGTVDTRYIIGRVLCVAFPGVSAESGKRDYSRIGGVA
jgi:signal peptidase I